MDGDAARWWGTAEVSREPQTRGAECGGTEERHGENRAPQRADAGAAQPDPLGTLDEVRERQETFTSVIAIVFDSMIWPGVGGATRICRTVPCSQGFSGAHQFASIESCRAAEHRHGRRVTLAAAGARRHRG